MSTPDELEQQLTATGEAPVDGAPDVPLEAEAADVAEQARDDAPAQHVASRDLPGEADEADAAEQATVVHLDEDEAGAPDEEEDRA